MATNSQKKLSRSIAKVKVTNPLLATAFALTTAVFLLVFLSCCAAADPAGNPEDQLRFNREDRGDYRPLQFGKRDGNFRPLQFGKKNNYRPLQFGKRAVGSRTFLIPEFGGGVLPRNDAFNMGGDVEFF